MLDQILRVAVEPAPDLFSIPEGSFFVLPHEDKAVLSTIQIIVVGEIYLWKAL